MTREERTPDPRGHPSEWPQSPLRGLEDFRVLWGRREWQAKDSAHPRLLDHPLQRASLYFLPSEHHLEWEKSFLTQGVCSPEVSPVLTMCAIFSGAAHAKNPDTTAGVAT